MSCAKIAQPTEMPFGLWTRVGPRKHVLNGVQIPHVKGKLLWERTCWARPMTFCHELCKNSWTDRDTILVVGSDGLKEPYIRWIQISPPKSTNGKSIGPAIFAQLTAECCRTCSSMSFPLITAPSHGESGPHLIDSSLGPPKSITQMASQSVQLFWHRSRQKWLLCRWHANSKCWCKYHVHIKHSN